MEPNSGQSLTDHLSELRKRLIRILLILAAGGILSFTYSEKLLDVIREPVMKYLVQGGLVYTGIMDKITAHIKISILAGVVLTAPLWLYQIWMFIAPGLYRKEKKYGISFLLSGTLLFVAGVCFCYFVVYPAAFQWLFSFGGDIDKPMITIDDYISFFITTLLIFGAVFEMPLVIVFLGIIGLIDQKFLREKRRYAIVILAILAGVLTPGPDILSQVLLLLPMLFLYEVSAFLVGYLQKPKSENPS